jgi:predicted type IV restriction endonuclease
MPVDISRPLKKYLPHLLQAQRDNLNEADTVQRLIKVFEDVLGYDSLTEISREAQLKNKYVDMALKIDGVIRLLVEAKAAGVTLRDRHIEQAQAYASRNNFQWVLLTNGVHWNLYHLTFEEGIEYERAFSVDLSAPESLGAAGAVLSLIHRQSIRKGEHEDFWEKQKALGPASIGRALFHEQVLRLVRREIRKNEGLLIDSEDLASALHGMFSADAREVMGPVRIRKRRPPVKRASMAKESNGVGHSRTSEMVGDNTMTTPPLPAPSPRTDPPA